MDCDHSLELMSQALDGPLSPAQQAELSAHLNTCPHCAALYRELAEQSAALRALDAPFPEGLHQRILDQLPAQQQPKGKGRLVSLRRWGALAACAALPSRREEPDEATWPYLEIRVEERQPEPGLLHEVTARLADRAVRLCRMVREVPDSPAPDAEGNPPQSLHRLEPADVARRFFENRYHAAMPDGLAARFERAAREAADESAAAPEAPSPKSEQL